MKKRTEWKIAIVVFIFLSAFADISQSGEPNDSGGNLTGEIRYRYEYIGVDGDRGRFREDNWMTDRSTGGIDWLHLENVKPAENEYKVILEGKALHDYDYDMSLLLEKENSHYFKFDFDGLRRYFDGSNEYWDESLYNLPRGSGGFGSIGGTSEHPDDDFFVDRRNYNVELGLTPPDAPNWVFGWHRLEKDGKEVLLRGGLARSGVGAPNFRGIPAVTHQKGITDTFYGEVSQTFAEKYNFRIRQEFEQYRDSQLIESPRYLSTGALDQYRTFRDEPGYTNWRTMAMFDSFLDNQTYFTANYMYNYLNNDTSRDEVRPNRPNPNTFVNTNVGNSRRTNVVASGYRRANLMQIPTLDLSAGVRVEDSKTSSQSNGWADGTTLREAMSKLDEVRVGETLRLVYKGFERTTLSFDADLEQRYLDWSEYEDVRSYEIFAEGAPEFLDRKADIDHIDQIYTFKGVHRFSRDVKSTFEFRIKDLERSYTERFDNASIFYPGYLGSYRRRGNDTTFKTDWRLNSTMSTTLMYQFVQESIDTELGGKTSNLEIHRGMGSLSFSPKENLFLVGSFMLENYNLDTPAIGGGGNNIALGSKSFDYVGNSYSVLLDGTYAFNENTSCTLGFQHTEAMGEGDGDNENDSAYDMVSLVLKRKVAENRAISLGYQFINFNNHNGGSWDDYKAHGVFVTYTFTFQ